MCQQQGSQWNAVTYSDSFYFGDTENEIIVHCTLLYAKCKTYKNDDDCFGNTKLKNISFTCAL